MNAEKYFDDTLAEEYIQRALQEGRSEDDGWWDYLEKELGIRRLERTDEVLREVAERERRSTEKFLNTLANLAARAAVSAPVYVPIAFRFANGYVDELIEKIENSNDPKLKPAQKWLKTHKDDLLAELQY